MLILHTCGLGLPTQHYGPVELKACLELVLSMTERRREKQFALTFYRHHCKVYDANKHDDTKRDDSNHDDTEHSENNDARSMTGLQERSHQQECQQVHHISQGLALKICSILLRVKQFGHFFEGHNADCGFVMQDWLVDAGADGHAMIKGHDCSRQQ